MISEVAPRRDYRVDERSPQPVESVEEIEDQTDGTRSVQDLIAAALKMFASIEPTIEPAPVQPPAIDLGGPNIEAAVQQVLDQIITRPDPETGEDAPSESPLETATDAACEGAIVVEPELPANAPITSKGPVATTAVREPAPLPENENPNHVNLVLEDGPERIVVTVAVRGNEVNAMIRGGDEQTAAAIARNAASLDHALRAGGLDLASFTSERDLDQHAPREREQRGQEPTLDDLDED